MNLWKLLVLAGASVVAMSSNAAADQPKPCAIPAATVANIQNQLAFVVSPTNFPDKNGGLFSPNLMWSAVVDRYGVVCSVIASNPDAWPGSRSIAMAKAYTANAFSNAKMALSTANLFGATQPDGFLYGLNNSNPFNPGYLPQGSDINYVAGGIITFGGGVALYQGGQVIGGLGVSGDTSCADHAIAYRMRHLAGLDGTPNTDNIAYPPSGKLPGNGQQPHCISSDITP